MSHEQVSSDSTWCFLKSARARVCACLKLTLISSTKSIYQRLQSMGDGNNFDI